MKNLKSEDIIDAFLDGKTTPEVSARLETWYLLKAEQSAETDVQHDYEVKNDRMWMNIQQAIKNESVPASKVMRLSRISKWAAAAAIFLIFSLSVLYYKQSNRPVERFTISKEKDIAPGKNSAFLILANGKRVDLSSSENGVLLKESGLSIVKTNNGQIVYHTKPGQAQSNKPNTIQTPVGGQYMVILPDGSKVWLNAASSLTYPTAFDQDERKVSLTGEGYFEIAHLMQKSGKAVIPFVVTVMKAGKLNQQVKVLGTHFNINSYPDEPVVTTTLLQGSVVVNTPSAQSAVLKPQQQAILKGLQLDVSPADTEVAMAWKNGEFIFREDLASAMRKVARWYGVEVSYEESAPKNLMLGGWMSRETNISAILNHIQSTGKVHFTIEGRRVIVSR